MKKNFYPGHSGRTLFLASLIFFASASGNAFPLEPPLPVFNHEFWFNEESPPVFDMEGVVRKRIEDERRDKIRELLDEAVFVYSGMIYGFSFSYTPGDLKRGVGDSFEISPAAEIVRGDAALTVKNTRRQGEKTFVRIEYRCGESHRNWIQFWDSSAFPLVGSSGEASYLSGFEGKKEAVENSVREAVRSYMRNRVYNKPRSITGSFSFAEPPVITYLAGGYTASVRIRLDISEVESYTVF